MALEIPISRWPAGTAPHSCENVIGARFHYDTRVLSLIEEPVGPVLALANRWMPIPARWLSRSTFKDSAAVVNRRGGGAPFPE